MAIPPEISSIKIDVLTLYCNHPVTTWIVKWTIQISKQYKYIKANLQDPVGFQKNENIVL